MLFFRILFILNFYPFFCHAKSLPFHICADDFRLELDKKDKSENLNIDILKMAIQNLKNKIDIELNLEHMPLSRCFELLKKGQMDAALNLSYNEERASYLEYPPESGPNEKETCSSQFKVACSGYVVITMKSNLYEYNGKQESLPLPVRSARGYSITKDLEKIFHDRLETSKSDKVNILKLIRDNECSVIAHFAFPVNINKFKKMSDKIKIHKKYFTIRSYFIPFSKKSKFPETEKKLFWEEIAKIANNKDIIDKIISSYSIY